MGFAFRILWEAIVSEVLVAVRYWWELKSWGSAGIYNTPRVRLLYNFDVVSN